MSLGHPAANARETVVALSFPSSWSAVPPLHSTELSVNHSSDISMGGLPLVLQVEEERVLAAMKEIWRKNCGSLEPQQQHQLWQVLQEF